MFRLVEQRTSHNRAPHQLPAGRHGLPRAFVVSNQRERILDAVLQAASRSGYAAMRIEDVIAIAGVSRRTFYDHFANKEEAFLAAYELVLDQLLSGVTSAFATGETWTVPRPPRPRRVPQPPGRRAGARPGLRRRGAGRRPARAGPALGGDGGLPGAPAAAAGRRARRPPPPRRSPIEAIVGGIYEVIYSRVTSQRTDELPTLLPSLLHSALLPFVGPEVAEAEYQRVTRSAAQRAVPTP